jgi:hypothetical protein
MTGDGLSEDQVLYFVGQADAELFRSGMDIRRRHWEVPRLVMRRLGFESYVMAGVGKPPMLDRIEAAFKSIYRSQDIAMGGHIGVFMYRDIFARISVPHVFGQVGFNPFDFVELTPVQLRIIQSEPEEMEIFLDQFADVADIQYGSAELKAPFAAVELVQRFIGLARLHLHAAAAVLTGGYDYRGAVQSALLACELALKSGAAMQGLTEPAIKSRFGHDLSALADFLGQSHPSFDRDRVRRVIARQPQYVLNRYASAQPARREAGHLVMGAQYLVSEVVRQMSDRDFRAGVHPPLTRRYPA